jgi:hypothetical protein
MEDMIPQLLDLGNEIDKAARRFAYTGGEGAEQVDTATKGYRFQTEDPKEKPAMTVDC